MSTKTEWSTVSGYARGAASARLRPVAPLSPMSGVGVCPPPATPRADRITADLARIGRNRLAVRSYEQSATHLSALSTRQFDKPHPGSHVLRPPV